MDLNITEICERCRKVLADSFLHVHDRKVNIEKLHIKCKFHVFHRRIVLFYHRPTFVQICLQDLQQEFVFFRDEALVCHEEVIVYQTIFGEIPTFAFLFPSVILVNMNDIIVDMFSNERFDMKRLIRDIVRRRFRGNINAIYNLLPIVLETMEMQG